MKMMKENIDALFEVKLGLKKSLNRSKSQTESLAGHLADTTDNIQTLLNKEV